MLISSGSEKAGQVNPAMKDMAMTSMEMAKVSMKNNKSGRVHDANEGSFRCYEKVVTSV
jgi:hypothetical protein